MNTAIGVDKIIEIIETFLLTSRVKNFTPISTMLIAPSGAAKSLMIKQHVGATEKTIFTVDSITGGGIFSIMKEDPGNTIRFIRVIDFNITLSRKPTTLEFAIANLLSMCWDGTVRTVDGGGEKVCRHSPVGFITAATPEMFFKHQQKWYNIGLTRRIIPIFYEYSPGTLRQINNLVESDNVTSGDVENTFIELEPSEHITIPPAEAAALKEQSTMLAMNLGKLKLREVDKRGKFWKTKKMYPISPHVSLRTIARAHAIRAKRKCVNEEDIKFIDEFMRFTDPESPGQL